MSETTFATALRDSKDVLYPLLGHELSLFKNDVGPKRYEEILETAIRLIGPISEDWWSSISEEEDKKSYA